MSTPLSVSPAPNAVPVSSSPVPVVPATRHRLTWHAVASVITGLGFGLTALTNNWPGISAALPGLAHFGPTVTAIGGIWRAIQYVLDQGKAQGVNYTPPEN